MATDIRIDTERYCSLGKSSIITDNRNFSPNISVKIEKVVIATNSSSLMCSVRLAIATKSQMEIKFLKELLRFVESSLKAPVS